MRIIGGKAGGRLLKAQRGLGMRPTPDLMRQALFNSLAARVAGARILELFAGSGALGLECLSRGASRVVAVEKSTRHAAAIRENLTHAGLPRERFALRNQDAFAAVHQLAAEGEQFDLVFADPPFGEKNVGRRSTSLSQQLLDEPALPKLVAPNGLLVLGHARRDTLTLPPTWLERKTLKHGDSVFRYLEPAVGQAEASDGGGGGQQPL